MAKVSRVVLFLLNGLLLTAAIPQYGPQGGSSGGGAYGGSSSGGAPPPPPPPPAAGPAAGGSYGGSSGGAPAPAPAAGGSSGAGGDLTVQCKASPDSAGKFKYDCAGVNKDAITLKTEHFLWLENQAGSSQNLDIEIPNYNIDEFIKAAYKALGPQEGAKINIQLKKPEVTYNAAKDDAPKADVGAPSVSVNYQPVDKVSVHYPTQKQYTSGGPAAVDPAAGSASASAAGPSPGPAPGPAQGPAPAQGGGAPAAPAAPGGGGAYSRPQRESGYRYYFVRQ